jgi:hypothetical protein
MWECLESSWCECHSPDGVTLKSEYYPFGPKIEVTEKRNGYGGLDFKWKEAIQQYSRLNLTCSKDKLPAIAGIAMQFANKSKKFR